MANKKTGRPTGSKTDPAPSVDAPASRCPACGSTERKPYYGTPTELAYLFTDAAGNETTHVVWKNTNCLKCGQKRRDKIHENRTI